MLLLQTGLTFKAGSFSGSVKPPEHLDLLPLSARSLLNSEWVQLWCSGRGWAQILPHSPACVLVHGFKIPCWKGIVIILVAQSVYGEPFDYDSKIGERLFLPSLFFPCLLYYLTRRSLELAGIHTYSFE